MLWKTLTIFILLTKSKHHAILYLRKIVILCLEKKKKTYNWLINNKTIKSGQKFIDTGTCHNAARALVFSLIDYCNALFTCLSAKNTSWLQRLHDSGARVVFAVGRRTEAEPPLTTLHSIGFLYLRELLLRSFSIMYIKHLMNRRHCT